MMLSWPERLSSAAAIHLESSPIGVMSTITLFGEITRDDVDLMSAAISEARAGSSDVILALDSPGGDVLAAIEIGRLVRANAVWTTVIFAEGSGCYSACVFVLMGGVVRLAAGTDIGIHRPRFEEAYFAGLSEAAARAQYEEFAAQAQAYLADMGADPKLFHLMMQVPSGRMHRLTEGEKTALSVDGWDPSYQEWVRAKNVQKFGSERYQRYESCRDSQEYRDYSEAQAGLIVTCLDSGQTPSKCYLEAEQQIRDPCSGLLGGQ